MTADLLLVKEDVDRVAVRVHVHFCHWYSFISRYQFAVKDVQRIDVRQIGRSGLSDGGSDACVGLRKCKTLLARHDG